MKRILAMIAIVIAAVIVSPVVLLSLLCGFIVNVWLKLTARLGDGLLMSASMALLIIGPVFLVITLGLLLMLLLREKGSAPRAALLTPRTHTGT